MALIALKCPQCGGDIQLDNIQEVGFCMYCGTKVVIQEAIRQRVTIDETPKIHNWITLGFQALNSRNYVEAEQYANKIIETEIKNPYGWYFKGRCAKSPQFANECWNKAMDYAGNDEFIKQQISSAMWNPNTYHQNVRKTVKIFREKQLNGFLVDVCISIDKREMGTISNGGSLVFQLDEGSYLLSGKGGLARPVSIPLEVHRDRTVHVSFSEKGLTIRVD